MPAARLRGGARTVADAVGHHMADPGAGGDRRRARRTTQGPVGGPHPDQGGNRRAEPRAAARRAHRVDEPAGDRRLEELRPALGGGAPRADEPAEGHARRMVRPRRGAVRTAGTEGACRRVPLHRSVSRSPSRRRRSGLQPVSTSWCHWGDLRPYASPHQPEQVQNSLFPSSGSCSCSALPVHPNDSNVSTWSPSGKNNFPGTPSLCPMLSDIELLKQ